MSLFWRAPQFLTNLERAKAWGSATALVSSATFCGVQTDVQTDLA